MQKMGLIDQIHNSSREHFYIEYILADRPVIIKQAVNQWPAYSKWSLAYFDHMIGDMLVTYRHSPSNLHPDLTHVDVHQLQDEDFFKKAILRDFLAALRVSQGPSLFLCASGLSLFAKNQYNDALKALMDDFELPLQCNQTTLSTIGLWLSLKHIVSWLHYDKNGLHNLNAQIQGKKRVLLFPPQEIERYYLYPYPSRLDNFSQLNVSKPDYVKYPLFKKTSYYEGILDKGDLLYIPPYWLHSFEHLGDVNINLNFWWNESIPLNNPLFLREQRRNSD